ncbi:YdeI/OmpD-associated family protein [Algirhabdus cladophorae]|uniref:YdeI/OmpD-associated family protein n=1 Tax=Algirhabdus cladophorae TaxID=3377108 RepID=UPI003B848A1C
MSDYIEFEGHIVAMEWGKNTYTVLPIPPDVVAALGKTKRVEGEINDHLVNLALTKAPVIEGVFVYTGKAFLARLDIDPSQPIGCRLRPAPDDLVETPTDVMVAVNAAGLSAQWAALTSGKQRGLLHQIESAKRAQTRQKRIAALISELGT